MMEVKGGSMTNGREELMVLATSRGYCPPRLVPKLGHRERTTVVLRCVRAWIIAASEASY